MDVGTTVKHPMVDFMRAVDQLRHEHEGLKRNLIHLETMWSEVAKQSDEHESAVSVQHVAQRVDAYLKVLHAHANWEDDVLFPMVSMYFQDSAAQVNAIEAEHLQAEIDLKTFVTMARATEKTISQAQKQTLGINLLHACRLLNNHFLVEEEIIFPLAEEILEDIDYMSL